MSDLRIVVKGGQVIRDHAEDIVIIVPAAAHPAEIVAGLRAERDGDRYQAWSDDDGNTVVTMSPQLFARWFGAR